MTTKLLEKESVKLRCPHCKKDIDSAWVCKIESFIGTRYAFMCNYCQKLLGISANKDYTLLKSYTQSQASA
ncbi:hypothetical protein LJE86_09850 [bacterium BMS3Abin03]|jgi:glutaredoxin|nr:hypothetical protein [bacterium BMS3Abin03]MCG6959130.1 hypothetical protein [bacterium BMS3Abin03]